MAWPFYILLGVEGSLVDKFQITSVYSADPIRPNSSAPQLPKIMDLRGLQVPTIESHRGQSLSRTLCKQSFIPAPPHPV